MGSSRRFSGEEERPESFSDQEDGESPELERSGESGPSESDRAADRSDGEDCVVRWLRALDLQVVGACRADERLRPLLKLNVSTGPAEDRLLAQLSQHFEVSEIGMLARCLCVPLVSIRVGKINKIGTLLCPTSSRGNLNLTILPSSCMRLSFTGDNGQTDQLAILGIESEQVTIEEISADSSGRSFLLRISESQVFYYWCSEKSMLHAFDLLDKMKDIMKRRPTLSELTGISNSRLDSFGTHLQAYLLRSSIIGDVQSSAVSASSSISTSNPPDLYPERSSFASSRPPSHYRLSSAAHTTLKSTTSLSPRSSNFKDGIPRSASSSSHCLKNSAREKLKRHTDCTTSQSISFTPSVCCSSLLPLSISESHSEEKTSCSVRVPVTLPLDILSSFPSFDPLLAIQCVAPPDIHQEKSQIKPQYCWCPPFPFPRPSTSSSSSSLLSPSLPPLSSLLSAPLPAVSPMPPSIPSVNATASDLPPSLNNLPKLMHDPRIHLPLPVSSLIPLPSSQFPTFNPLMSDPIVHIPLMDVCSSGQAYLVSAGPAISCAVPPLVKPLIPATESLVEKSARETLRRLLASAPELPTGLTQDVSVIHASGSSNLLHVPIFEVDDSLLSGISSFGLSSFMEETTMDRDHDHDDESNNHFDDVVVDDDDDDDDDVTKNL